MKALNRLFIVMFCLFSLNCAGGSQGTGGSGVYGRVVTNTAQPVEGATVTVLETGDSDTTNAQGEFAISTDIQAGDITVNIQTATLEKQVLIQNLPQKVNKVLVDFEVDEEKNEIKQKDLEIEEKEEHQESSTPTPKPTKTRTPTPIPTAQATPPVTAPGGGSSGEGTTPTSTPTPDFDTPDPQPTSTPQSELPEPSPTAPLVTPSPTITPEPNEDDEDEQHQDGEEIEAEGKIETLNSTSIQVKSTVYLVTATTRITQDGITILFSKLKIGDQVKVKGQWYSGQPYANKIELKKKEQDSDKESDKDKEKDKGKDKDQEKDKGNNKNKDKSEKED